MATSSLSFSCLTSLHSSKIGVPAAHSRRFNFCVQSKAKNPSQKDNGTRGRRVWRRRKLTKKDEMLPHGLERTPFLEEQVRKIRDEGKWLGGDIERLLLSEDNRFDFVNEVAAEANQYVDDNPDEYGAKKAILHVLSNRFKDAGIYRPEAYGT